VPLLSAIVALSALGTGGSHWYGNKILEMRRDQLSTPQGVSEYYNLEYLRQIAEQDEFVRAMWRR
jgi:hypothetical protein